LAGIYKIATQTATHYTLSIDAASNTPPAGSVQIFCARPPHTRNFLNGYARQIGNGSERLRLPFLSGTAVAAPTKPHIGNTKGAVQSASPPSSLRGAERRGNPVPLMGFHFLLGNWSLLRFVTKTAFCTICPFGNKNRDIRMRGQNRTGSPAKATAMPSRMLLFCRRSVST
jgi:hypothetical protein